MSVAEILSSNLFDFNSSSVHSRADQFRKEFQQLGQDLQTGNLAGAQADFAALQQNGPQTCSTQSSDPIAQAFQKLSADLQSGNLTEAQQDFTTLQQDFQNQAASARPHHHHHMHFGGNESSASSAISQIFSQLALDLQSGNLASGQQAYSTLQQDLQQFAVANGALSGTSSSAVNATA
jgi:hypothetical protein